MDTIGQLTGIDIENFQLADVPFLRDLTLNDLVGDVPFLGDYALADMPNLAEQIGGAGSDQMLSEYLSSNPEAGQMTAGDTSLGSVQVSDVPNLGSTHLGEMPEVGDDSISNVPGLSVMQFGQYPGLEMVGGLIPIAKQDISFGAKEYSGQKATPKPVSGGTNGKESWEPIGCVGGCAHIELYDSDISPIKGAWAGSNWMTSKHRVKDGFGVLGAMFNEAGAYRVPFGPTFALQVRETDEKTGDADWGIAFRVCYRGTPDLGCTAYFMEVPLPITTHEGATILTGIKDGLGGSTQPIKAPDGWEDLRPEAPKEPRNAIPSSATEEQIEMDSECLQGLISASKANDQGEAASLIPKVVAASNKHGLSKPQLAYVLATVRAEIGGVGWRTDIEEIGKPCGYEGGCGWHGRGPVQLTHRGNYERMGKVIGQDLVGNPSLAMEPEYAVEIMVAGMKDDIFAQGGTGLDYYINDQRKDYVGARRLVNVQDRAYEIAQYAEEFETQLNQCNTLETKRVSAGAGRASSVSQSASQLKGMDTSAGPEAGNQACVWAVNKVLANAGIEPIGGAMPRNPWPGNQVYVPGAEYDLQNGRGTQVSMGEAKAGDIVIEADQWHIGICQNDGCSQVISNSSSRASFNWESNADFNRYYGNGPSRIYRLNE